MIDEIMAGMGEILNGGINWVERDGDRVLRPTGLWSPRVHGLLQHLATVGFRRAPGFYGLTDDGREILDFLPGTVPSYPMPPQVRDPAALASAADLLRAYHDAVAAFAARAPRDGWQAPVREPVEVICHGDFAPYNCVLDGTTVAGIIDFDFAHPGPRLWDVAYAAYRWVPLVVPGSAESWGTRAEQVERLRFFADRYGLDPVARAALPAAVAERLTAMVAIMREQAARGHRAFARHLAEGHHLRYAADAAYAAEFGAC